MLKPVENISGRTRREPGEIGGFAAAKAASTAAKLPARSSQTRSSCNPQSSIKKIGLNFNKHYYHGKS